MSRGKKRAKREKREIPQRTFMQLWDGYWYGPIAAVRPYLLMKTALFLLAFDVWLLRVPRGWRFGADDFNVAHFQWLDSIQPLPTPGLYIGIALLVGIVAFMCALVDAGLWMRILLALLYAYSWMMSMLDNYQHHYFLSLVLLAFVFFPTLRALDLYQSDTPSRVNAGTSNRPLISAWAYVLLGVNTAILYLFTAVNKMESGWQVRTMFERLAKDTELVPSLEAWLTEVGLPPESFWLLMQVGVVGIEILIVAAYLLAVRQDEQRSLWRRIVIWSAFIAVIVFHGIMNEWLFSLRIGWFSYYMIAFACIYFLPARLLWEMGRVLTWPGRKLASFGSILLANFSRVPKLSFGLMAAGGLAVVIFIVAVGIGLDLPGAAYAGYLTALLLLGVFLFALVRGRYQDAFCYITAIGLATVLLWATVTQTTVRFVYYDEVGTYLKVRKKPQAAIEAYEKALLYLPPWKERNQDRALSEDGAKEIKKLDSLDSLADGS